jgi:DnaJ homologue, subfamily C, member 28, conserved domain
MTKPRRPPQNPFAPVRETLIDRQIREAMEEGKFDALPHQGERLPLADDSAAGDWALAYRMLRCASFAPPWIETDKDVRTLLARRDAILERAPRSSAIGRRRDEKELREVVEAANRAIFRLNHEAPTLRQHRQLLDLDAELTALAAEAHRAG